MKATADCIPGSGLLQRFTHFRLLWWQGGPPVRCRMLLACPHGGTVAAPSCRKRGVYVSRNGFDEAFGFPLVVPPLVQEMPRRRGMSHGSGIQEKEQGTCVQCPLHCALIPGRRRWWVVRISIAAQSPPLCPWKGGEIADPAPPQCGDMSRVGNTSCWWMHLPARLRTVF